MRFHNLFCHGLTGKRSTSSPAARSRSHPIIGHMITLAAVIRREEDMYVAECPEVGTAGQGKNIEEAAKNLKEATELYLEEFPLKSKERSIITDFSDLGDTYVCPSSLENNPHPMIPHPYAKF